MMDQSQIQKLKKVLKKYGQSHLLAFWDRLDPARQDKLLAQLNHLDFAQVDRWRRDFVVNPAPPGLPPDLAPAPYYPLQPHDDSQRLKYDHARQLGAKLISEGKVAAFVVAGGQGTRLGFDGPKGNFSLSPVKNKTLFRIFAETITAVSRKYHATCPWYVMTSPLNHDQTLQIFRDNDYYHLDKNDVFIFRQGTLPNFDLTGKILLADLDTVAASPDGHGGCLKALRDSGALDDMKKRGIEFISYWQVDNPLVNIFDPLFIGLHALDDAEMSSKGLNKTDPLENVGNFCLVNGKITVIEYTEFNTQPEEITHRKNTDGSPAFLGSIAIHLISTSFVERFNKQALTLPLHKAVKKINHIDNGGRRIEPAEPNGIKLESFVFDALPLATKSIILQTRRSEEFSPTKNATGVDSVETTRQLMIARAASWLESADVKIPRKPDGSPDCTIEIAPSFALTRDDVIAKRDKIPPIKPGDKLYLT